MKNAIFKNLRTIVLWFYFTIGALKEKLSNFKLAKLPFLLPSFSDILMFLFGLILIFQLFGGFGTVVSFIKDANFTTATPEDVKAIDKDLNDSLSALENEVKDVLINEYNSTENNDTNLNTIDKELADIDKSLRTTTVTLPKHPKVIKLKTPVVHPPKKPCKTCKAKLVVREDNHVTKTIKQAVPDSTLDLIWETLDK